MWLLIWLLFSALLLGEDGKPVTVRVVDAQSGEPVARALIESPGDPGRVMTAENGEAVVPLTKRGGNSVTVRRTGYEPLHLPLIGEKVIAKLEKHAVVQGRVTDRFKEPVPGLRVEVVERPIVDGYRLPSVRLWCETNDLGEYRLGELRKGNYDVRVGGRTGANYYFGARPEEARLRERYKNTSVNTTLEPGEVKELPFEVEMEPAYSVKGRLEGYTRAAMPSLQLLGSDGLSAGARFALNIETGAFEWSDVGQGEYSIVATDPLRKERSQRSAKIPITVTKENISGIQVALQDPVIVKVSIQGCEEEKRGLVAFYPAGAADPDSAFRREVSVADGKVLNPALLPPGRYQVFATLGTKCSPASIRAGAQDVLAQGLVVAAAAGPMDVQVAFGPSAAVEVKTAMMQQVRVMALPLGLRGYWSEPEFTGENGTLFNLPPGEYVIVGWKIGNQVAYHEEEVQERLKRHGVRVTVSAGQNTVVELRELLP